MSIGEIVGMYERNEIVINPDFQRLFRWTISQKSKLIESILLGIPLPPIFVFEKEDGIWELVDGLQRLSTLLEFMGLLRKPGDDLATPSIMEATKYLPSLHNAVWERSDKIPDTSIEDQLEIDKSLQLAIRRSRIGVEILKRPSDNKTKFDLFQRLNAGGTQANPQELRNCIMLMVNPEYYRLVKTAAENTSFQNVIAVTEEQIERQRHLEFAVRFLVLTKVPYDGSLDVEEFIDEGIVQLATAQEALNPPELVDRTFSLINSVAGRDALRRLVNNNHVGKVGLVGFECIAVGVAKNLTAIMSLHNSEQFVKEKINGLWSQSEIEGMTAPGLRGTIRLKRTVPFGEAWFRP